MVTTGTVLSMGASGVVKDGGSDPVWTAAHGWDVPLHFQVASCVTRPATPPPAPCTASSAQRSCSMLGLAWRQVAPGQRVHVLLHAFDKDVFSDDVIGVGTADVTRFIVQDAGSSEELVRISALPGLYCTGSLFGGPCPCNTTG